jgi:predicted phage terminase large subunit-like protein
MESIRSHKDKYTRLLGVAGMIEVGDVYFLQKNQDTLIDQLTQYPDVEHDDEMDALVFALAKAQTRSEG